MAIGDYLLINMYIGNMKEAKKLHNWQIEFRDVLPSTQMWLRKRVETFDSDTAVFVDNQTAGRGRQGRQWLSSDVGLFASLLFKPAPSIQIAPSVSLFIAFLLVRILESHGIVAKVKWPNDVIVNNKKLAGIIAESGTFPVNWFILGIGVNLSGAPEILERDFLPAGAWAEYAEAPSAIDLLEKLVVEINLGWKDRSVNPLIGLTEKFSSVLWRQNRKVCIKVGQNTVTGIITGIEPDGALLLATDSGCRRFVTGELKGVDEYV